MSGGSTTQTSNAGPWAPAQPYLKNSMKEADRLYKAGTGGGIYRGRTTPGLSQSTNQGLGRLYQAANAGRNNLTGQSIQAMRRGGFSGSQIAARNTMSGFADRSMMGEGNPYLRRALDTANESTRDAVNMNAMAAGRYGSANHATAMAKAINDSNSSALFGQYNQDADRVMNASTQQFNMGQQGINNMRTLYENSLMPANTLLQVGAAKEQQMQNLINDKRRIFEEEQSRPWELLERRNAIMSGAGRLGDARTVQTSSTPNVAQAALNYGLSGKG